MCGVTHELRRALLSGAALLAAISLMSQPLAAEELELNTPGVLNDAAAVLPGLMEVKDGKPDGIMGEVFTQVGKRLGLDPKVDIYDFPALIPVLLSDRSDIIGPGLSITQPRAQVFYFAPPVLIQPETIAVRPGTKIESWEQAKADGLTLASITGYFQIGLWEGMGIKVHAFDNVGACMLDVAKGGSDGCDVGAFDLAYFQLKNPGSEAEKLQIISVSGPSITTDMNSFGVSKGRPALSRAVNAAVRDMWRDGTMEKIWKDGTGAERYLNFINPPKGQALYVPGPWEANVVPPAAESVAPFQTVKPGVLTVGKTADGTLLAGKTGAAHGAEADILAYAAKRLGLTIAFASIDDPVKALDDKVVDIVAGGLVQDEQLSKKLWYTLPFGFSPDYIYLRPNADGSYPAYKSWQDVTAAGGKIAVEAGNPRIADIGAANVVTFPDAAAALKAVANGSAGAFVGSTVAFAAAVSGSPELVAVNFSWVRNANLHVKGEAYAWAARWGNAPLVDALDNGLVAAWQNNAIAGAYRKAFRGANVTALTAPGPTAIGTSFGASKDYQLVGMFLAGPWTQRPGWKD